MTTLISSCCGIIVALICMHMNAESRPVLLKYGTKFDKFMAYFAWIFTWFQLIFCSCTWLIAAYCLISKHL